ncbi:hypothetical protein BJ878DRAFT_543994 [Calycina marina]|uniref:Uncharacterized protein n=1 Tax=Calycina marina TaxID=1763456 RepID=A0A9P7YZS6_9HELO|nr:hypothetical protein BJ878DRAFT_543994 [Calycina marina]
MLQKIKYDESHVSHAYQTAELYEHHDLALKELQQFIQVTGQSDEVKRKFQILACIVQFISFDLFREGRYSWEFHLQAAAALAAQMFNHIDTTIYMDATAVAITFMCGVVLWLDILSTVTAVKRPLLWDCRERKLSLIQMDKTVACRNWVAATIAEIGFLGERKAAGMLNEQDMWYIDNQVQQII